RWRPAGVLGACLVFGAADALQLRLQGAPFVPASVWIVLGLIGPACVLLALLRGRLASWGAGQWLATALPTGVALVMLVTGAAVVLPAQLWTTAPYVVSLVMLAGAVGRSRVPSALAVAFRR